MARPSRLAAAGVAAILAGIVGTAAGAQERGEGTMLVRQSTDCSGTGTTSTVHFPFSAWFTGFEPNIVGEVTAFTQPGGQQVGHRTVTVDDQGNSCQLVEGTVPPGQYKIVYDFGSGTGKQKVITVTEPTPTPTPTVAPTAGPTPTATATPTVGPTPTGSVSPSTAPSSTPSGSPTTDPSPSPQTEVEGRITFRTAHDRANLARTGLDLTAVLGFAVVLLVSGAVLVAMGRARTRSRST